MKLFHSISEMFFTFLTRKHSERKTFLLKCVRSGAQQAARKRGNFGAKLTHPCGFWLDVSFFSHVKKHRSRFWLDVSFFSCVKTKVHSSDWLELICLSKFTTQLFGEYFSAASYPDVSLSIKMWAQRKAGRSQRARRGFACVCILPMVPYGSSPVAPLLCKKRSARGGGWFLSMYIIKNRSRKKCIKVENYLKVVGFRTDFFS